jgi:hypothetical protein
MSDRSKCKDLLLARPGQRRLLVLAISMTISMTISMPISMTITHAHSLDHSHFRRRSGAY